MQSKWHWQKFEVVHDLLRRAELPRQGQLLDIACGPGTFIGMLDHPGSALEATGVDIAGPQIAYATKYYAAPGKRFLKIQPGVLPFPDNIFDAVTMIELIEHLTMEQTHELLAEARRVLKPGGLLVLSTPNYHSGWPLLEMLVNRLSELSYADQHINKFHRKKLSTLLQQMGFRNETVQAYQGLAPFGAMLSWEFANQLLKLERGGLANLYGFLLLGTARK